MNSMKILSLWQPWASFMALGYKANETRSLPTSYRGLLAIHAARNTSALEDADDILGGTKWPLGEIVAVVDLIDCKRTEDVLGGLGDDESSQVEAGHPLPWDAGIEAASRGGSRPGAVSPNGGDEGLEDEVRDSPVLRCPRQHVPTRWGYLPPSRYVGG